MSLDFKTEFSLLIFLKEGIIYDGKFKIPKT